MNSIISPTNIILFKVFNGLLNNSIRLCIFTIEDIIINNIIIIKIQKLSSF